ncbi:MAG: preprotein translocase subunit SecE [Coriobacteriales bacterium]|jgi:preprotein translocase subunit SecE
MAKKTRAERKKEHERALKNPNQAAKKDLVGDSSASASEEEKKADVTVDSVKSEDVQKEGDTVEASKSEVDRPADAPEMTEKQKAREEKEQQKRIQRAKKAAARAETKKNKPKKRRGPKFIWTFVDYLKNVRIEMKRVVWPTRQETWKMTLVVIIALVFFFVLIYIVDSAVTPLLYWMSGIGG